MFNDYPNLLQFDGMLECTYGSSSLRFEHRFHEFGRIVQPMPLHYSQYEKFIAKFRMSDCSNNLLKMLEHCSESFKVCISKLNRLKDPMRHFRIENQFENVLSHETDYWDCVLKVVTNNRDSCRKVYKQFMHFKIAHKSPKSLQTVKLEDNEKIHVKCDFDDNLRFLSLRCV